MARGYPSLTPLLGLLAVAGYQNRDKIAEWLRNAGGTAQGHTTGSIPGNLGVAGSLNGGT